MVYAVDPIVPLGAHDVLVFLIELGLLLLTALVLGRIAARFGQPAVVGELCAGVLLGPSLLAKVWPAAETWLFPPNPAQFHLLDAVGQVGVLLLVGITGLEIDLSLVRRRGITAARISLSGIVIPLGLGVATGFLFPASLVPDSARRTTFALFLGVAMGISAIPVIAKTLMEMRLIHRNVGQLTLCAVVVDDIIGWLLLSVTAAMASTGVRSGDVVTSIGFVLLVVVVSILLRPAVRGVLRSASRSRDSGVTTAVVVIMVLLWAAATQGLRLEAVFGAFVAGVVIKSCNVLDPARLEPLRTLVVFVLAPLFFATAGLRMDLTALAKPSVLAVGLTVLAVAIVGKFVGAFLGAKLSRLNRWEALAVGAGMNARGVIEVVVAMVGLRLGVLSTEVYTIIVLVAIVTSVMAPPLLRFAMARVEHTAEERLRAGSGEGVDAATTDNDMNDPARRQGASGPPSIGEGVHR
jgi:Kef-type K+ transport system membrane component KefB